MSIFVNPEEEIKIKIFYKTIREDGVINGIDTLNDYEEGADTCECTAVGRINSLMCEVIDASVVFNSITGQPMVKLPIFRKKVIQFFFKSWNQVGKDVKILPINEQNINNIHYSVVKSLVNLWLKKTGGEIYYDI